MGAPLVHAKLLVLAPLAALLSVSTGARAAEVQVDGFYRARFRAFDTLSLSRTLASGEGLSALAQHRLWLRPRFLLSDDVQLVAEIRALDGVAWGDQVADYGDLGDPPPNVFEYDLTAPTSDTDPTASLLDITLWRIYGQVDTDIGRWTFGRVPLMWGSGIWLNDGISVDPLSADYGDSTDRVQWEKLFEDQFYLRASVDVPAERLVNVGDDTTAFGLGLAYKTEAMTAGAVLQLDHTGRRSDEVGALNVFTADLAGDAVLGKMDVAAEVVGQFGGGDFDNGIDGAGITAVGAVLEAGLEVDRFRAQVQGGLATGDGNPNDKSLREFTFDRDYSVGMFLFEQPMPTLAAATPTTTNGGRDYSQVVTGTALSNALFLKPQVTMNIVDGFSARVAWLGARVAKSPPTSTGVAQVRSYGNEFQIGANYSGIPHFEIDAQGGLFLPGGAYTFDEEARATEFTDPAFGLQVTGRISF
ncbi:MAG: hypothetical protein R3F59_35015 [Myxococcota bacterium]